MTLSPGTIIGLISLLVALPAAFIAVVKYASSYRRRQRVTNSTSTPGLGAFHDSSSLELGLNSLQIQPTSRWSAAHFTSSGSQTCTRLSSLLGSSIKPLMSSNSKQVEVVLVSSYPSRRRWWYDPGEDCGRTTPFKRKSPIENKDCEDCQSLRALQAIANDHAPPLQQGDLGTHQRLKTTIHMHSRGSRAPGVRGGGGRT